MQERMFRPVGSQVLAGVVIGVASVAAIGLVATSTPREAMQALPWLGAVAGLVWAMFWFPKLIVHDAGISVVNVWSRTEIPWTTLLGLHTKWTLTLETLDRPVRVWAAPSPGVAGARNVGDKQAEVLMTDAAVAGEIRPGDLPDTTSGAAASIVRQGWMYQQRRGLAVDSDPRTERVTRRVHTTHLGASALLFCLIIAGFLV